jgi:hypothetical protein
MVDFPPQAVAETELELVEPDLIAPLAQTFRQRPRDLLVLAGVANEAVALLFRAQRLFGVLT